MSPVQWQLLGLAALVVVSVFLAVIGILFAVAVFSEGWKHDR